MQVRVTLEAHGDVAEAKTWYEVQAAHVVPRFVEAYGRLLARLEQNPHQFPWTRSRPNVRRADFGDFPYGLFFRIGADEVEVFACLHARRHPRRWQRRA